MFFEESVSPLDAALGGRERTLTELGDRLEAVFFDVPQRPRDAFRGRQRFQQGVQLSELSTHFWRSLIRGNRIQIDGVDRVGDAEGVEQLAATKPAVDEPHHDGSQPGPKCGRLPQVTQTLLCLQEGVMHDVLDIRRAALNANGQVHGETGMPTVQRLEREHVAFTSQRDELQVFQLRSRAERALLLSPALDQTQVIARF